MEATDEQIEAMCKAHVEHSGWSWSGREYDPSAFAAMKAALATLQPEPVPGAAVRQAVESGAAFIRNQVAGMAVYGSVSERLKDMQAALEQDGLASAELPTREQVAHGLRDAWLGKQTGGGAPLLAGSRFFDEADYVLSLLARRPATDEAEALRTRAVERRGVIRVDSGGLLSELAAARDLASERDRESAERIADLEARLAAVTKERDEALARLAARPEPVVIDEALANRVVVAYEGLRCKPALRYQREDMHTALRSVFGDRASVSVPQGEPLPDVQAHLDGFTDQLTMLLFDSPAHRGVLDDRAIRACVVSALKTCGAWDKAAQQRLRAELEKTRGELEADRKHFAEVDGRRVDRIQALTEQHEALRDGVRKAAAQPTYRGTYDVVRGLLKPAPAEAEADDDLDYAAWCLLANVSEGDWTAQSQEWQDAAARWRMRYHAKLGGGAPFQKRPAFDPAQHPPPESAMVEHERLGRETPRLAPILAELDLLWKFVARVAEPDGEHLYKAAQEALDARKGG